MKFAKFSGVNGNSCIGGKYEGFWFFKYDISKLVSLKNTWDYYIYKYKYKYYTFNSLKSSAIPPYLLPSLSWGFGSNNE